MVQPSCFRFLGSGQVSPVEDLPGDRSVGAHAREPFRPACAHDISVAGTGPADIINSVQEDPAADQ
jgi:hypothetical protein